MMYSAYMEKEMATHSSIFAWRISWTSLVGYNPWGHKESDTIKWLAFLPRSKLQSPSAVILEPKKIKSVTVSYLFAMK